MLALVLLCGGMIGTALGVWTFTLLRSLGQLDLMIALSYVILLTTVGGLMFWEGLRAHAAGAPRRRRFDAPPGQPWLDPRPAAEDALQALQDLSVSVIPVVAIGLIDRLPRRGDGHRRRLHPGAAADLLLRVPTSTVIGTSMVLTLVTMVFATMLHAVTNHLVDAVLALILMIGGVTGAQFGARAGQKIRGEHLRLLLGLLVLAVGVRFAVELVLRPEDLFTIRETGVTG